jgi:hypothetical protein
MTCPARRTRATSLGSARGRDREAAAAYREPETQSTAYDCPLSWTQIERTGKPEAKGHQYQSNDDPPPAVKGQAGPNGDPFRQVAGPT